MEHFLLAASWKVSLPLVGKSGGLPEPAVATANATAALAELDLLNKILNFLRFWLGGRTYRQENLIMVCKAFENKQKLYYH